MIKAILDSNCSDRLSSGTMTFLCHTIKTDIRKKKKEYNTTKDIIIKQSESVNKNLWNLQ